MAAQVSKKFLTAQLVPDSNLHWALEITHFFDSTISMDPIIAKRIHAKIKTVKNDNVSYALQWSHGEKNYIPMTT